MGVAFENQNLRKGPIWPAISLMHQAGLTVVSGLPKPSNFN